MAVVSTHVLDTEIGEPVGGVKVALYKDRDLISLQETDEDGRIANLFERDFWPGEYRLEFDVNTGFFEGVALTIALVEDRHYHVPLLVSSYMCASYRGS